MCGLKPRNIQGFGVRFKGASGEDIEVHALENSFDLKKVLDPPHSLENRAHLVMPYLTAVILKWPLLHFN